MQVCEILYIITDGCSRGQDQTNELSSADRENSSLKNKTETSLQILTCIGYEHRVISTPVKNLCLDVLTVRAALIPLRDW